jgi:hypothetical protein
LYRLCGDEIFVDKETVCVEKAGDEQLVNDPGQEKGGCARDPL